METLVPPPALVALVPVALALVALALVALALVALALVALALVALALVALALVALALVALAPVEIVLNDGGTSSISGLMSGRGGSPYCSCSRSCCLTITCVEKSGPLYPIVVQSMITAANETPITSIPNATPRICGE